MGTVSWQRWRWGCHKRGGKKGVAKKRWQKRGDKKEVPEKTQMVVATVGVARWRWQQWAGWQKTGGRIEVTK